MPIRPCGQENVTRQFNFNRRELGERKGKDTPSTSVRLSTLGKACSLQPLLVLAFAFQNRINLYSRLSLSRKPDA